MAYFNGDLHLWAPKPDWRGKPVTAVYCDLCAEAAIPLAGKPGDVGRHWGTDFKWAPHYGAPCHKCGRSA